MFGPGLLGFDVGYFSVKGEIPADGAANGGPMGAPPDGVLVNQGAHAVDAEAVATLQHRPLRAQLLGANGTRFRILVRRPGRPDPGGPELLQVDQLAMLLPELVERHRLFSVQL